MYLNLKFLEFLDNNNQKIHVSSLVGIEKEVQTPNVANAFKLALMLGDVRLMEEKEGVAGDIYILDASVATPTHFAKFTPTLVKKFLVCVQVISFCLSHCNSNSRIKGIWEPSVKTLRCHKGVSDINAALRYQSEEIKTLNI